MCTEISKPLHCFYVSIASSPPLLLHCLLAASLLLCRRGSRRSTYTSTHNWHLFHRAPWPDLKGSNSQKKYNIYSRYSMIVVQMIRTTAGIKSQRLKALFLLAKLNCSATYYRKVDAGMDVIFTNDWRTGPVPNTTKAAKSRLAVKDNAST